MLHNLFFNVSSQYTLSIIIMYVIVYMVTISSHSVYPLIHCSRGGWVGEQLNGWEFSFNN